MNCLKINSKLQIPLDEIRFSFARSSGPGGQNVNKVSSKAILRWKPNQLTQVEIERLSVKFARYWAIKTGEVVITSQCQRDAVQNKNNCLEKFVKILKEVIKTPKKRIPTKPTKSSIKRRLEDKAKHSLKKQNRKLTAES
ncbi:MAG: aminoacyl-tRNA hydrolase [Planctomycetaceae bacterium]|jgi:ribosome-associated protein|nr:aminoacyl-tRNA hydrolase [Planctomycetaceae bacterium]